MPLKGTPPAPEDRKGLVDTWNCPACRATCFPCDGGVGVGDPGQPPPDPRPILPNTADGHTMYYCRGCTTAFAGIEGELKPGGERIVKPGLDKSEIQPPIFHKG